ncbi:uncharacterized protein LOC111057360 isoform X1 [Nilaparvata lugens]|uniref:uncharacterized protein LOC111057360 isoform X1 n=1 Tax=Nilaparvata lugens TaxID=108931 RepID=UPI00193DFF4E|nr:uncharacterized protein LOC111057360 isoform X1 [Nilaparvata lugens]
MRHKNGVSLTSVASVKSKFFLLRYHLELDSTLASFMLRIMRSQNWIAQLSYGKRLSLTYKRIWRKKRIQGKESEVRIIFYHNPGITSPIYR